jgi:hypothetical protein
VITHAFHKAHESVLRTFSTKTSRPSQHKKSHPAGSLSSSQLGGPPCMGYLSSFRLIAYTSHPERFYKRPEKEICMEYTVYSISFMRSSSQEFSRCYPAVLPSFSLSPIFFKLCLILHHIGNRFHKRTQLS